MLAELVGGLVWLLNLTTILISVLFFKSYVKIKKQTLGLKMVLILNLFTWTFPVTDILEAILEPDVFSTSIISGIMIAVLEFSIFWTATFAIFTFRVLRDTQSPFNAKAYFKRALVYCIVPAASFVITLPIKAWNLSIFLDEAGIVRVQYPKSGVFDQIMYFGVYEVMGKVAPSIIIFYCYLRVYKDLRRSFNYESVRAKRNLSRILGLSISPLLCLIPLSIADLVCMYMAIDRPFGVNVLRSTLLRLWGISNLLNYWFFIPRNSETGELTDSFTNISGLV